MDLIISNVGSNNDYTLKIIYHKLKNNLHESQLKLNFQSFLMLENLLIYDYILFMSQTKSNSLNAIKFCCIWLWEMTLFDFTNWFWKVLREYCLGFEVMDGKIHGNWFQLASIRLNFSKAERLKAERQ